MELACLHHVHCISRAWSPDTQAGQTRSRSPASCARQTCNVNSPAVPSQQRSMRVARAAGVWPKTTAQTAARLRPLLQAKCFQDAGEVLQVLQDGRICAVPAPRESQSVMPRLHAHIHEAVLPTTPSRPAGLDHGAWNKHAQACRWQQVDLK